MSAGSTFTAAGYPAQIGTPFRWALLVLDLNSPVPDLTQSNSAWAGIQLQTDVMGFGILSPLGAFNDVNSDADTTYIGSSWMVRSQRKMRQREYLYLQIGFMGAGFTGYVGGAAYYQASILWTETPKV